MDDRDKYPVNAFVYYRDNFGDMIIAQIVKGCGNGRFLSVRPGWYAEEPVVFLPLRPITGSNRAQVNIPTSIVEKVQHHAPA
jgi:hypothetical protein